MPKRTVAVATPIAHLVGPGCLKVINRQLSYCPQNAEPIRIYFEGLKWIFCYGGITVSDTAIDLITEYEVELVWLTSHGQKFKTRLERSDSQQTSFRLRQYSAMHDSAFRLQWAKRLVRAKIESQIHAMKHYRRHQPLDLSSAIRAAVLAIQNVDRALDVNELRGIEGAASAGWFSVLIRLIPSEWNFHCRNRRPPTDPINALLSLGYTLLLTRVRVTCEAFGFETNLGCLHEYRPGRPSLVCDLMEPYRVPAVDRWVFNLCKQNQIQQQDFDWDSQTGGVKLISSRFPEILTAWETYWLTNRLADRLETQILESVEEINRHAKASEPDYDTEST